MLRLACERNKELGRSSEEDTLDLIKLLLEWRGRVSIVTEADEYYAAEQLNLDPENCKAILDLYEIIGPVSYQFTNIATNFFCISKQSGL